jgi:hypothetical protein
MNYLGSIADLSGVAFLLVFGGWDLGYRINRRRRRRRADRGSS